MHFIGCGDIPCQLEEQYQREQLPNSVGSSKELRFPNSLYDLQNCVKELYGEVLKQSKVSNCFDRVDFGEV